MRGAARIGGPLIANTGGAMRIPRAFLRGNMLLCLWLEEQQWIMSREGERSWRGCGAAFSRRRTELVTPGRTARFAAQMSQVVALVALLTTLARTHDMGLFSPPAA